MANCTSVPIVERYRQVCVIPARARASSLSDTYQRGERERGERERERGMRDIIYLEGYTNTRQHTLRATWCSWCFGCGWQDQ